MKLHSETEEWFRMHIVRSSEPFSPPMVRESIVQVK